MKEFRQKTYNLLRKSEKYFKTDMVYFSKGGFWLMSQFALSSTAGLLLFIFLAHILDATTFGTYRYIISFVAILGAFSLTWMTASVTEAVARGYERTLFRSVSLQIKWGMLAIFASIIVFIYYLSNENSTLGLAVLVGTIGAVMGAVFNTFTTLYNGRRDFRGLFITTGSLTIVQYGALALAALFTHNLILLIATFFLSGMLMNILLYVITVHRLKPKGDVDENSLEFGKKMSFLNIISLTANNIDNIIVFHFLGAANLAIYATALVIPEKLRGISKLAMPLMLPKLTLKENEESAHAALRPKLRIALLMIAVLVILYIIAAPTLFEIIFPKYTDAVLYSQIFAISIFAGIAIGPVTVFVAQKSLKNMQSYSIVVPIVQTFLVLVGTILFGLLGAVISRTVALLFGSAYSYHLSKLGQSKNSEPR